MVLYFGSRAISAAGNFLAVAWFARLVGPAEYGAYILVFAWAIIVYGFSAQWMKFAYFGVHRVAEEGSIIASYGRLMILAVIAAGGILLLLGVLLPLRLPFVVALFALFAGMTIYEAVVEVSRTRLQVKTVAFSMVARALLVLLLGYVFLLIRPTALMLALGVSAGHLLAAIPGLLMLRDFRSAPPTRAAAMTLIRYGWPLIFSFGVFAIGQTIDRFLVSHYAGNAVLGPYGVVADMMRQSYMVVGESIALALITVAKRHADEGLSEESNAVMRSAFCACMVAAAYGAAFFILFGHGLVHLLLGADFAQATEGIIPYFAIAFGFMVLRSFYFAQVIYFTDGAFLELLIAVVFVVTSALLAVVLVPRHGAVGGAISLMVAQGAACLISAVIGRRLHVLPVEMQAMIGIPVVAGGLLIACWLLEHVIVSQVLLVTVQMILFLAAVAGAIWRFDLSRLAGIGKKRRTPAAP